MKIFLFVLVASLACLSLPLRAQPVYEYVSDKPVEAVVGRLSAALSIRRSHDIGQALAASGDWQTPFTLLMLEPSAALRAGLDEDPNLAVILPATLYVRRHSSGQTRIGIVDITPFLTHFALSDRTRAALRAEFKNVYSVLARIGQRQPVTDIQPLPRVPYAQAYLQDFEPGEARDFLTVTLREYGLSVVDSADYGAVYVLYAYSLDDVKTLLREAPVSAIWAPYRLYFYPRGDQMILGSISMAAVAPLYGSISADAEITIKQVFHAISRSFADLGAELVEHGQWLKRSSL